VVKLLLARNDVDPDKPDNGGRTPLWGASSNGHVGVVRLLLARGDVDPNKSGMGGETPLWRASRNGHNEVVRLLLTRKDVNPNILDRYDKTPLCQVSSSGHEGAVSQLFPPEEVNRGKLSPLQLWYDSWDDCGPMIRLLLRVDGMGPDKLDNHGQAPLRYFPFFPVSLKPDP